VVRTSRWLWVPSFFGGLLFVALILWWLPLALTRMHSAFGMGQVIGGDSILAWKALLRCGVAYIVTIVAITWLPPIRMSHALGISVVAFLAEVLAEYATGAAFGPNAGTGVQLIATGIVYSVTVVICAEIIKRRNGHGDALV
jgi:hypothetical protein